MAKRGKKCGDKKIFMDRHEFGRYLANLRVQAGLSQEQMEHKTGLKKSYINSLEQGVVKQPGSDKINKIVSGYNLKEEDVLNIFYGSHGEEIVEEHVRLDAILNQIRKDRTFGLNERVLRALAEPMGLETKKLIIQLYEKLTLKKLL